MGFICWKCLILCILSVTIVKQAHQQSTKCTKVSTSRMLRELYENSIEEAKTRYKSKSPMVTVNNIHDTHEIEQLLSPDFTSWTPKSKVSIYNIIIKRLWEKILLLGNDPRVILKLKHYIMKKLKITGESREQIFGSRNGYSGYDGDNVYSGGEGGNEGEGRGSIGDNGGFINKRQGKKDCTTKGHFNKQTNKKQFCIQCKKVTMDVNRFPQELTEYTCSNTFESLQSFGSATCLDGYGNCTQNTATINILRKTNHCVIDQYNRILDLWIDKSIQLIIRTSCTCDLPARDIKKYSNQIRKRKQN